LPPVDLANYFALVQANDLHQPTLTTGDHFGIREDEGEAVAVGGNKRKPSVIDANAANPFYAVFIDRNRHVNGIDLRNRHPIISPHGITRMATYPLKLMIANP
jgi:hypothetical protein